LRHRVSGRGRCYRGRLGFRECALAVDLSDCVGRWSGYVERPALSTDGEIVNHGNLGLFSSRCERSTIEFKSRKVWSIVKRLAILGNFLQANNGGKIMIHLIWYIVVGLIA